MAVLLTKKCKQLRLYLKEQYPGKGLNKHNYTYDENYAAHYNELSALTTLKLAYQMSQETQKGQAEATS